LAPGTIRGRDPATDLTSAKGTQVPEVGVTEHVTPQGAVGVEVTVPVRVGVCDGVPVGVEVGVLVGVEVDRGIVGVEDPVKVTVWAKVHVEVTVGLGVGGFQVPVGVAVNDGAKPVGVNVAGALGVTGGTPIDRVQAGNKASKASPAKRCDALSRTLRRLMLGIRSDPPTEYRLPEPYLKPTGPQTFQDFRHMLFASGSGWSKRIISARPPD